MAVDRSALQQLIAARDGSGLAIFLAGHSNLPGPRGNLELAAATADLLADVDADWAMRLVQEWIEVDAVQAGGNEPRVMLPFVAAQTVGALWQNADAAQRATLDAVLHRAANDARWRVREGAAMGLQRIGFANFHALTALIESWSPHATLLECRAIVAGLAEPPLLTQPDRAAYGFDRADAALTALLQVPAAERKRDEARALRAALGYGFSVFLAADPAGFHEFARIAAIVDPDARWIVKENLKKARIAKRFPNDCAEIAAIASR